MGADVVPHHDQRGPAELLAGGGQQVRELAGPETLVLAGTARYVWVR
ncbi:hypothetical protein ACFU51_04080 [Streptomyces sp. NPDC057430]